jgi:Coenzyme PQQ synthesis protein D (PqqD)
MLKITEKSIIEQGQGNVVSDMNGEKVMMSIENGKYYNLGAIGGVIWDEISIPISISNLVEKLSDEYDIETQECMNQVISFIDKLKDEMLIKILNEIEVK